MKAIRLLAAALSAAPILAVLSFAALTPTIALACACGGGVFGVGTASLFPSGSGGQAWVEYDYANQFQNRAGETTAPKADNADRQIATDFFTLGGEYMFNRRWGVQVELPYWRRTFRTTVDDGSIGAFHHADFGDVRLTGMYTGSSPDMSTGVSLGVKLPTGDFSYAGFDRDTAIGTGSTDLLVGGYHLGPLNKANTLSYFAQALWDRPFAYQGGYRPGQEVDAAAGVVYTGFSVGKVGVAPVLQLIGSHRDLDSGARSNPEGSGYDRLLASPGVELTYADWKFYGDVQVPFYQRYHGDQVAAPVQFKAILSKAF